MSSDGYKSPPGLDFEISPQVKENMQQVLSEIQDGSFAQRFIDDQDNGAKEFQELRDKEAGHPIEATGKELRSHFSWQQTDDDYTEGSAAR